MNRPSSPLPLVTLLLLLGWSSCHRQTPEPVAPKPAPVPTTTTPAVDLLKIDPASLMEGVYTRYITTRNLTRIGIDGPATNLLIKRLGNYSIGIYSIYGQMNSYRVNLASSHDTIADVPDQAIDLSMVIRDTRPVSFYARGTGRIMMTNQAPDLASFFWINDSEFRPLSRYRSVGGMQPSLSFLTGIYTAQFPTRLFTINGFTLIHRPIVVKQVSSTDVELSDINQWEKPIRFTLEQSAADSTWTGNNGTLKIAITVKGGQPQGFVLQPIVADTSTTQWPPLNFEYDVRKPSYSSNFISL